MQRILQEIMKKMIVGTSDPWSMSHSSQRPSEPVYYIEDCRIFVFLPKFGGRGRLHPPGPTARMCTCCLLPPLLSHLLCLTYIVGPTSKCPVSIGGDETWGINYDHISKGTLHIPLCQHNMNSRDR